MSVIDIAAGILLFTIIRPSHPAAVLPVTTATPPPANRTAIAVPKPRSRVTVVTAQMLGYLPATIMSA